MANGKNQSIKITSIQCHGTNDTGGFNDEVYIIYQSDAGLPIRFPLFGSQNMNTSADSGSNTVQQWNVDLVLDFDQEVLVTLWDSDEGTAKRSDFLINCDYDSGNPPASFHMQNNNGADYTINAEAYSE